MTEQTNRFRVPLIEVVVLSFKSSFCAQSKQREDRANAHHITHIQNRKLQLVVVSSDFPATFKVGQGQKKTVQIGKVRLKSSLRSIQCFPYALCFIYNTNK